ncbi:MAG: short chain dehydrogenase [Marinilabiliales bacterium]|nr:MAG: short chain dehydrogenase [Marinilabiliales bacterium]
MNWNTKVVLVTGASSGIGEAICRDLLKKGASVAMAARSEDKMKEIAKDFAEEKVLIKATDVSKEEDCVAFVEAAAEKFGKIDVLINNAGISMRAIFEDLDISVIKKLMDVNFWGTVYCTNAAYKYLLEAKGSLVGVSSIAGFQGLPARTGYSSSKFAMHGLLNTIRVETLKQGLHVMIACPGFTASNIRNTALTADGTVQADNPLDESKLMTSEEVAARIVRGIEKRKRTLVMTVTGKLTVKLGKFFPKWVDNMVFNHMNKEKDSPLKTK